MNNQRLLLERSGRLITLSALLCLIAMGCKKETTTIDTRDNPHFPSVLRTSVRYYAYVAKLEDCSYYVSGNCIPDVVVRPRKMDVLFRTLDQGQPNSIREVFNSAGEDLVSVLPDDGNFMNLIQAGAYSRLLSANKAKRTRTYLFGTTSDLNESNASFTVPFHY